jgi:hypothetical protein
MSRRSFLNLTSDARSREMHAFPAWQHERVRILHRKFLHIEAAMLAGVRFNDAVKGFVWRWRGKPFLCDRKKRAKFSRTTLRNLFCHWKRNGRNPACLFLRYNGGRGRLSARLLCRFVEYCRQTRHQSLRAALNAFRRCELTAAQRARLNYCAVACYFTGSQFRRIQSAIRAGDRDYRRADSICSEAHARIIQLRRWYER